MLMLTPGRLLDLGLERVGALGAAVERHRRHAHHQIVRRAGHHAAHRVERVLADHLGAGHEGVVAHGLGVGRENPAVVVGDAGRPHHLEIGLHDGVGRGPEHAELAPPAENVSHRRSCWDFRQPFCYVCAATESASSMPNENDRVIVVGAGPVGLTAALALAPPRHPDTCCSPPSPSLSWSCAARPSIRRPSTCSTSSSIVPRMIEVGLKAPTWQFRDRETGPVATFDLSLLAGDTNHPYRVQCEQWKLMRFLEEKLRQEGADLRFGHEVTAVRQDGDGGRRSPPTPPSGPVEVTGRYVDRRRRRAERGAPLARRRVRGLHLCRAVPDRLDRFSVREHADRHRLCQLHRRSAGMAGAAAGAGAVARAGAGAGELRQRTSCCRTNIMQSHAAARGAAARALRRSRIARSIMCTSAWRKASGMAACCSPATPPTSTIRSAAWA